MSAIRGPDFFIVGAPKSGTTAMAQYLGQHPEIGMCPRKEIHFFADDLSARRSVKLGQRPPTPDQYLALFEDLQDRPRLGEASVWYLASEAAPGAIQRFCPEAQIIVMLRNPIEMVPSLHSQFVYVGIEPVEDLSLALALDEERERAGAPPGFPPRSYRAAVDYVAQLRRYLDVFDRDQILVLAYDDFRADTRAAVRETFDFLGVDSGFEPVIEVVNPNKQVRSRSMRRLVRRPPEGARRMLHAFSTQRVRRSAGALLKRWNTSYVSRAPVPPDVTAALRPLAAQQAAGLSELLGLRLDGWLEGTPGPIESAPG